MMNVLITNSNLDFDTALILKLLFSKLCSKCIFHKNINMTQ